MGTNRADQSRLKIAVHELRAHRIVRLIQKQAHCMKIHRVFLRSTQDESRWVIRARRPIVSGEDEALFKFRRNSPEGSIDENVRSLLLEHIQ